jgi:hypothetical protein
MDLIAELARTRQQTLDRFSADVADLGRRYGPGKWSVRAILHHLADAELVYLYRIRRVISQPDQIIWATDQDAWARSLAYDSAPLDVPARVFTAARDALIETAIAHYAGSERIMCVHSLRGRLSLRELFDGVVAHNINHLDQIDVALGR